MTGEPIIRILLITLMNNFHLSARESWVYEHGRRHGGFRQGGGGRRLHRGRARPGHDALGGQQAGGAARGPAQGPAVPPHHAPIEPDRGRRGVPPPRQPHRRRHRRRRTRGDAARRRAARAVARVGGRDLRPAPDPSPGAGVPHALSRNPARAFLERRVRRSGAGGLRHGDPRRAVERHDADRAQAGRFRAAYRGLAQLHR